MVTPKEYLKNLKNRYITIEMLDNCLYSVNKRAKNYRDQKRKYRRTYDYYGNEYKNQLKESEMYSLKEELLGILKPVCIHREIAGYDKTRMYSTKANYKISLVEHALNSEICWMNSFISYEARNTPYDEFWMFDDSDVTYFFDWLHYDRPNYRYYKFYQLPEYSYHIPITEEEANELAKTSGLEIRTISQIVTAGRDITDLVSMNFVNPTCGIGNFFTNVYE